MFLKIILGLIMGLFAGSSAKAATTANGNPLLLPANSGWFYINSMAAPAIAFAWIVSTFTIYPVIYGFMAIGEVIVGAVIAGFLTHDNRVTLTGLAIPILIVAWAIL